MSEGNFELYKFETEAPFEKAVIEQTEQIFGKHRFYLDCKRRIGGRDGKKSIPDGYLIDLSRRKEPQLYVVENEIVAHDVFKHIGVQLLQFSVSFKADGHKVKQVLHEKISGNEDLKQKCESYAQEAGLRNLDYLLEYLIFKTDFRAIVIIDEVSDELIEIQKQFQFPIEVIEFKTFQNDKGIFIYEFEPFLEIVDQSIGEKVSKTVDPSNLDTIVVPAQEDGFKKVFLGENRWYAIRLNQSMIPQIKYIAGYQIAPNSAITYYAKVKDIQHWQDSDKYVLNFKDPAMKIGPIKNSDKVGERVQLQGPRYANFETMQKAKRLLDVFY